MKLCIESHAYGGDIVFDDAYQGLCPVCELQSACEELETENERLERRVEELEEIINTSAKREGRTNV